MTIVYTKPPCSVCGRRNVPINLTTPPKCDRCLELEWTTKIHKMMEDLGTDLRSRVAADAKG